MRRAPQSSTALVETRQLAMLETLMSRQRRLSCGIVVLTETRELLLCHVTGQRHWDSAEGRDP